ncbi:MAG TPA: hypothetical protein VML75_01065 [Kofleriaceae bacterium]|nr:hypothetical protein [Kofleriaceae bacterium]
MFTLVCIAAAAACTDNGSEDHREACAEARTAVVDRRLAPLVETAAPELQAELEKHRVAMERSLGDPFIERCLANGPSYVDCIVRATDAEETRRCDPDYRL